MSHLSRWNPAKRAHLVTAVIAIWMFLVVGILLPWRAEVELVNGNLAFLANLNVAVWWIILLWGLHHLAYQLAGLMAVRRVPDRRTSSRPAVAVLYTTCDDFDASNVEGCLRQDYSDFRVLICDDSRSTQYLQQIDEFVARHRNLVEAGRLRLVRRGSNEGFKAGNLNHAFSQEVSEEWVLLVDADQVLPPGYVSEFVRNLPEEGEGIAFVQAAHQAFGGTVFQSVLAPEVQLYYGRDLAVRETFGFVPHLGHGVMVRRSAWESVGGFPKVVSEDFAFALRSVGKGLRGSYCGDLLSGEAVPNDFGGFMVRLKKFASGTAELYRTELFSFMRGRATLTEKWDFCMSLIWYPLMPCIVANGFLSAYVIHRLSELDEAVLHPGLPYLYTFMLVMIFALHVSVTSRIKDAARFFFWSTAIYSAAMPVAGFNFLRHIVARRPSPQFHRTPKNDAVRPARTEALWMAGLGAASFLAAATWLSPFTPFLLGQGVAYACYALFGHLGEATGLGRLGRTLVYAPAALMIGALWTMWAWST